MEQNKRNCLSVATKKQIIDAVEKNNKTKKQIFELFGIPKSKHENLEEALLVWFKQCRA